MILTIAVTMRALAQEEPAFDVLVRIDNPEDRLLLDRVRGQTSDLNVLLLTDSTQPIEATLPAQLDTARKLSEQQQTRVVVWFEHAGEVVTVFVAEPAAGRVLVRRIEPSEGRLGGSAQQESAALVVRSAMRALAAGGEIGVTEQEAAPPPPPAPVTAKEPEPGPRPPAPLPEGWELVQFLGARSALDGVGKSGQHSLFGRLALRRGSYQGELRAALGFAVRLDDDVARVALLRHALSLHAAYVPLENRRFVVSTALGAGTNLFLTEVDGRAAAFTADDTGAFVPVLSADVTLRFMPDWAHQRVGVAALLGADVLPQALVVGYRDPDAGFVELDKTWHIWPTASLELVVRMK